MAWIHSGPVPSNIALLSNLKNYAPASKVRFLGCVTRYSTKEAILTLEHNYPPGNTLSALVDLRLLVNTVTSTQTQVGEWINVIGYIRSERDSLSRISASLEISYVHVQAILVWSTGPHDPDIYERALDPVPT